MECIQSVWRKLVTNTYVRQFGKCMGRQVWEEVRSLNIVLNVSKLMCVLSYHNFFNDTRSASTLILAAVFFPLCVSSRLYHVFVYIPICPTTSKLVAQDVLL